MDNQHISAPASALINPPEPSDLAVAIRVAQKMLAAYSDTSNFSELGYAQAHGALTESLRILLRAVGAETDARGEGE